MTLEDKIKALMESKKEKDSGEDAKKEVPDTVEQEPTVKIENPIDPNLTPEDAKGDAEDGTPEPIKESSTIEETSIDSLLTEEFSDDFKLKAKVIFQAAVKSEIATLEESLKEEYTAKTAELEAKFYEQLEEKTKLFEEKTSDKINEYLSYVAEEWAKDNAIAIESGIRTELTEEFINGLKGLFESSFVDLPEQKVDLYEQAIQDKASTDRQLMEAISKINKLTEEIDSIKRENIINESVKDFSSMDAERLKTLVEDFEFENESTFRKKIDILKSSFFNKRMPDGEVVSKEQLEEEFKQSTKIVDTQAPITEEKAAAVINPMVQQYLNAM